MRLTINFSNTIIPVSPSSVILNINGVTTTPSTTGNTYTWDIPTTAIWKSFVADIVATYNGITYSNTFTIFGYDLTFTVSFSTLPFSSFFAYRVPYFDDILLINTVALQTIYVQDWYYMILNPITLQYERFNGTNLKVCNPGVMSVRHVLDLYEYIQCKKELVSTTNSVLQIIPQVDIHDSTLTTSLSCDTCSDICLNINSENSLTIYNRFDLPHAQYLVDTVLTNFITEDVINVKLKDAIGNILKEEQYLSEPLIADQFTFVFTIPDIGDYVIEVEKFTQSGEIEGVPAYVRQCKSFVTFKGCNWYEIQKDNCNNYEIVNWSQDNATVRYTNKITNVVKSIPLESFKTITIILEDGVYLFEIFKTESNINYHTIVSFCTLLNCYEAVAKEMICNGICNCKNYEAFIFTFFTFANMLELDYTQSFRFLTDSKIKDIYTLAQVFNRLQEYCSDCGTTTDESDCGCK